MSGRLPAGVTPTLGPDATGVGWAYQYALRSDDLDLAQLRSLQDWFLKYELTAVQGVSEVATIGASSSSTRSPSTRTACAPTTSPCRASEAPCNGATTTSAGGCWKLPSPEFMVRGEGYIQGVDDVKRIALGVDESGTPISVQDVATVQIGPDIRRGLAELNGEGEVVGGIVIVRSGANVYDVVGRVKARLAELQSGLPEGWWRSSPSTTGRR